MAKNYFNRYVWLIDTINRHGHISREEISRLWKRSSLNDTGEELHERTFHNHREAILDTFGIEIKCDRSLGYYIANSDDLEGDGIRQWLLESLSMNNLLNESSDMRDRILFEKIPSSQKWLPVIVNAMRDKMTVEVTYQSFWKDEPSTFILHPYCLKLFKQRWYVLGRGDGYESLRIYALDERMKNVVPQKKALKMPAKFNAGSLPSTKTQDAVRVRERIETRRYAKHPREIVRLKRHQHRSFALHVFRKGRRHERNGNATGRHLAGVHAQKGRKRGDTYPHSTFYTVKKSIRFHVHVSDSLIIANVVSASVLRRWRG